MKQVAPLAVACHHLCLHVGGKFGQPGKNPVLHRGPMHRQAPEYGRPGTVAQ